MSRWAAQGSLPGCVLHGDTLVLPDLRWNNLGLLGGRALLGCFPGNRALRRLELAGNNIPGDVFRAVGRVWGQGCGQHAPQLTSWGPCSGRLKAYPMATVGPLGFCPFRPRGTMFGRTWQVSTPSCCCGLRGALPQSPTSHPPGSGSGHP